MNEYKWNNETQTVVLLYPDTVVVEGGNGWNKFQEYLSLGGQVDPWKTEAEIIDNTLAEKLRDLEDERNSRSDLASGSKNNRNSIRKVVRAVKLLNKKVEGNLTPGGQEETEFNQAVALADYLDNLDTQFEAAKAWLEDISRTLLEIGNYNVSTDPNWPVL